MDNSHFTMAWKLASLSLLLFLNACATTGTGSYGGATDEDNERLSRLPMFHNQAAWSSYFDSGRYASRLPSSMNTHGEKVIIVDPNAFAWGAYGKDGNLLRAGVATAGADYCTDIKRPCRTTVGTFRIYSMGDESCASKKFPVGKGGALMPFCMFFNGGQSLHGSPDQLMMTAANISHGCVHLRIPDAEWLRYHFADRGTKVIILPYS